MSSSEAAEIWGKSESYVRISLRQSKDKWPKGTYRRFGKTIVVTTKGMEAVTGIKDPRKKK
ncbi:helix-turn-helix domain-containing protein [Bombilactobacillus folatiphilus]|uniref:Helix-turn-helix domain-containing protein n=2 Tax=Bombilactobacillus folatiphilus TaxID=2923362 RepID=A0ABY4PCA8_9LACO|nr:helix-turn-helix domain-containing protein [Bombilactobacillus folatiphilus]UQS82902.1 helix-turn-helix domain-containing protein [Bombilactobacillus folatiphilus]